MPRTSARSPRAALVDAFFALAPAIKHRLQDAMSAEMAGVCAGATPHQMEALHYLAAVCREGGGVSMQELARIQHCALSSATALADRLIQQGLAERLLDASDRRVVRIVPTERGRALTDGFAAARHRGAVKVLGALDDDELRALLEMLRKMAGAAVPQEEPSLT